MQPTFDFLSNGGELGALMRARNWAATPLGPPQQWPETLKTTLRLVLTSNHPMFIWWGPDLIQFYNDGYRQTMGPERHPSALGQKGRECWGEIWHIIGPQIESIMAGGDATWHKNQLVPVTRHGKREDVWWTYGYSPIEDSSGVRGVLVICNDVSKEHQSREELKKLNLQLLEEIHQRKQTEHHQAFQLRLMDALRGLTDADEIAGTAFELLGVHLSVARINYAKIDHASGSFSIVNSWERDGLPSIAGMNGHLDDFGPEVTATLRKGHVFIVGDTEADPRIAPYAQSYASVDTRAVLVVPVIKAGQFVSALTLHQTTPYYWAPHRVSLLEGVAERVWNAMEHASADARHVAAEQALILERHAESERLQSLFQQAPGFMAILRGPNHVFEFVNAAYLRMIGERELMGRPVRDAVPEAEGQGFFELLDQVFTSGKPFSANDMSLRLRRQPNGPATQVYVDFVYQPIVDANGAVTGIFVEGIDATERHVAKAALQTSEERLKEGMFAARMVVWDWDLETGLITYSENAPSVYGSAWSNIADAWKSVHPDDLERVQASAKNAVKTRGSYKEDVRMIRADNGGVTWLQIHGKVICDEHDRPRLVRGAAVDITDRKRAEEALIEADRRKNEFLAMLAHELRNPLAPIVAAAELLSVVRHDDKRLQQASQIITRQVDHMTSLISDLLDVSRVTTGTVTLDKQPLDIKQIIAESIEQVRPFIEARRHHFTFQAPSASARVMGDRKRLVQVITNLLQNAAKFTPENGNITLGVEMANDEIVVSVRDNGAGIDAELLPHVFELFTQEKRSSDRSLGGLGIGLALVKSLAGLHGGRVIAASEGSGRGSTFTLFLPLHVSTTNADLQHEKRRAELPSPPSRLRLLIVDDNTDAAEALAMFLQAAGHEVAIEREARAALERVQAEACDVYLLDVGLPGMDGNELARRLRSMPTAARATLIALSGYGQRYDKDTSIAAGFDYYFVKPADPVKLLELLAAIKPAEKSPAIS